MARKYTVRSKEEKLAIVKEVLAGRSASAWEPEIPHQRVSEWVKKYQTEGEAGLEPKKKPGNPLSRYERRKELTYERLLKRTESTGRQALFHSDQGVQYSSAGYCNLLTQYNVLQSMSRAGVPRDNAVMESFWGRFKDTLRKHFRFWERDDLHAVVAECVRYFNFIRTVRKLNGKPPVLFRTVLVAEPFTFCVY